MKRLPIVHINDKTYFLDERLRELRNTKNPHDTKRFRTPQDLTTYAYWTQQLQFIVGKTVVSAEMEFDDSFDDWVPILRFGNGQRDYTISVGRDRSPVIYLERLEFLDKPELDDATLKAICREMELFGLADESDYHVQKSSFGRGRRISFRFWWD